MSEKTYTINRDELLNTFIEVEIDPAKFLIIAETLTRIGIYSRKKRALYQTCHLLHKRGKYYIVHFKELFKLDNSLRSPMTKIDYQRRNYIVNLLENWGLIKVVNPKKIPLVSNSNESIRDMKITVIPHFRKKTISTVPKYVMLTMKKAKKGDDYLDKLDKGNFYEEVFNEEFEFDDDYDNLEN